MFTKKYTGGKCAWDESRTDCAICAKTACSEGLQIFSDQGIYCENATKKYFTNLKTSESVLV